MLKGKRVLVTGAGGFIGSHLTEALVEAGAEVSTFLRYQSQPRQGVVEGMSGNGVRVFRGDLVDPEGVSRAVEGQDIVWHLGALISVPYSYENPQHTFEVNAGGTLNVLQAARQHRTSRIIVMSTSEVYGTALRVPIDERHPVQAQSPYSASKIAAEKLAESYFRSFGLPVVIVRGFNTYGPRQSPRAIIPAVIVQALRQKEVRIGASSPTRDFVFVGDLVRGLIRAAESEAAIGEVINLATGREISIADLVTLILRTAGRAGEIDIKTDPQRLRPDASEVRRLLGDGSKARELLGWSPSVSLDEGIRLTLDYVRSNLERYPEGYQT